MIFEDLKLLLQRFPKLMVTFTELMNEGYSVIDITMNANSKTLLNSQEVRLICEKSTGKRILLTSFIFSKENKETVFQYELPDKGKELCPGIYLNADVIKNKTFKKKFLGGYQEEEVDEFLDIVIADYNYIFEKIIKK
ncbi:DivIVA domain-containing protein [Acetivibrio cellulolyticus]|uniref:DivIVA domain-containing protein n=1 Tax=Acetivibrio cellulolyticus TaxID=35830 RepID=UPI0002481C0A|nr:DivIVA domain-containing protein [Acetivibrio cellulolyticus]